MYDISNRSVAGSPDDIGKILLPVFASLQSSLPPPVSSEGGAPSSSVPPGGVPLRHLRKNLPPVLLKILLNRRRLVRMELGSMVGSCAIIHKGTNRPADMDSFQWNSLDKKHKQIVKDNFLKS